MKSDLGIEVNKVTKLEKIGINKLGLFIAFCVQTKKLSASEKNKIKEFVLEKGKSEFKYIEICNSINFKKLLVAELVK